MKSPFPGMDPYLESRWSDVHATLIALIKESLQPHLPRDLRARSEERILLEATDDTPLRRFSPDVAVIELGGGRGLSASSSAVATVEPVRIKFLDGPQVDRFVQIIDIANGNRVVTAIEVLSPWNKASGRLNKEYMRKIEDYARGEVSVVEIDLLRSSRVRLRVDDKALPPDRPAAYWTCIAKAWDLGDWLAYPMSLQAPLPLIPIPLRQTDAEVPLNLQSLIERVYVAGGHDDIDYAKSTVPPLSAEDAEWARTLLKV